YSKVLQYENYRLFSNLRSLSRLKKKGKKIGRLRFKGKEWFKTFTYNQSGFKLTNVGKRCQILHLSKIGNILIRCHRNINGKIKQVTIKKEASGKWFASITAENKEEIIKTQNKNKVGIDLGILNYIYDSDGNHFNNPKHLSKSLKKLARAQKKLSKRKKGSNNRNKQRLKTAVIHEKITNQRNDFLHKLSRYYINNYSLIAIENLNIKGLLIYHTMQRT
ncbi:transposase, partial [Candidatus Woesearchaeota archaeon]|nr:transposase [Candidatus Woesearchaeota archaeon]